MSPLSFLGTVYRLIQESFINTENMLDLLDVQIEVGQFLCSYSNGIPLNICTQEL